jgi:phosphoribosyl-ATP pyrophosphohydrolase/phosphoribosyl-AMP cyclohydrolase
MLISKTKDIDQLAWEKCEGLIPAIVQDAFDGRVLMQAYMDTAALKHTLETGRVTFWSRSRRNLWTKGETSGNFLELESIHADCDQDSLLVLAKPHGPTCHLGTDSCFDDDSAVAPGLSFLSQLEKLIGQRDKVRPEGSYTTKLLNDGTKRIAQKVGEEGVETALAATVGDDEELRNEASDLLYHLLVLLRSRDMSFQDVLSTLEARHG